jgi:Xaa-Pro dipeptidase
MKDIYRKRLEKFSNEMKARNVSAVIFEDSEEKRDISVRYFSGHPSDAILIITADGMSTLIPWDENLAAKVALSDKTIPYTKFDRKNTKTVSEVLKGLCLDKNSVIEFSPSTSYVQFMEYSATLEGLNSVCKNNGMHSFAVAMRSVKDSYEIECTKKACSITCSITDEIEKKLIDKSIVTESDVALFIEKRLREENCERTGFDTLAAGPERSFAIHAFPSYTNKNWGNAGLSILDYGVVYNGYTSDATITIARGSLSSEQKKIISLVQKAADTVREMYAPKKSLLKAHIKAQEIFAQEGRSMPHSLGHGIGLEIHEAPFVSSRANEELCFEEGNIVTLEPGLYDPELGGVRLENDILITKNGNEMLTNSRIIML